MSPLDELKLWFDRDIRHVSWWQVDAIVDQPSVAEIRFTTKFFTYTITADQRHGESFLGCTCFDRQNGTSEYFPEGYFDEDAWAEIAEAIDSKELICARPLPGHLF